MNSNLAREILDSPNIVYWYAQNYCPTLNRDVDDEKRWDCAKLPGDDSSPENVKMGPLPIGLDFHTLLLQDLWGEKQQSLQYQVNVRITKA